MYETDHSLSVGAELALSSISPLTLLLPSALQFSELASDGEAKLRDDDDAEVLRSFFSFSLKSMKMRVRASWYSA